MTGLALHSLDADARLNRPEHPTIPDLFKEACHTDPHLPNRILRQPEEVSRHSREISLANCKVKDNRLIYRDCVYVPDHMLLRLRLLLDHHDPPAIGHPGERKPSNSSHANTTGLRCGRTLAAS